MAERNETGGGLPCPRGANGAKKTWVCRIERVTDSWSFFERHAAAFLLIAMTALYGLNVLVRVFAPAYASLFAWIDEASRYMMVWVVFLAAGVTLEIGRHVSVDLLRGRIGPRPARALLAAIDAIGFVFSVGAAVFSLRLALFVAGTGQISPTLGVPAYILYIAPTIGFGSLAVRFLLRLSGVRDARRWPRRPDWLGTNEG